ncbi:MAG: PD-(D/E)XK nuclease family protein, partial [Candidatus Methanoplasma sp.]|nr:PD-(D/E)XK nuclease family protein [Candidatus Methanoplasma sp.]
LTFMEVCDRVVRRAHRPQIGILLDDMRMKEQNVSSKLVNELNYAVNNIDDLRHNEEIPDSEKKGVLLADCLKSVYVDRPFVIYLGLGPEWTYTSMGKEYIDRETEAEQNMYRFSILLQQGVSRVYAVNSMRNGKESTPCPIFEQIKGYEAASEEGSAPVSGFKDVCRRVVKGQWAAPQENDPIIRGGDAFDPSEKKEWRFSKSTFNNYYACPRAYMYGKLISIPDSEQTMFGNIIHEFAEFYLCYPELVKGSVEDYTEMISRKYSGLSNQQMKEIDSSKIRVCMTNIIRFIDSLGIKEVPLDRDCSNRKYGNMFMEMHGCTRYSSMTETEFISRSHPLFGNFDLIAGSRIIDYKTGRVSTPDDVMNGMILDNERNYYEFQPIIYLSLLKEHSTPPYRFSLVYAAGNDVRSVTEEEFNIKENVREVMLIKETMLEYLSDPNSPVKDHFVESYSEITEKWGELTDAVFGRGIDAHASWKDDKDLISSLIGRLGIKSTKKNEDNLSRVLKKLSETISNGMYIDNGVVVIPSDTLDKFLSRIDESHDAASEQMHTEFPASPRKDCSKCNFFKACTKNIVELDGVDGDE